MFRGDRSSYVDRPQSAMSYFGEKRLSETGNMWGGGVNGKSWLNSEMLTATLGVGWWKRRKMETGLLLRPLKSKTFS